MDIQDGGRGSTLLSRPRGLRGNPSENLVDGLLTDFLTLCLIFGRIKEDHLLLLLEIRKRDDLLSLFDHRLWLDNPNRGRLWFHDFNDNRFRLCHHRFGKRYHRLHYRRGRRYNRLLHNLWHALNLRHYLH